MKMMEASEEGLHEDNVEWKLSMETKCL